jgi:outer membrane receptor protein involved in Fe transport
VHWSSEAGVSFRRARGNLGLVAFHQLQEDGIERISVVTPEGNKFQRVNQGRSSVTGIESTANVDIGPLALGADLTLQHTHGSAASGQETELEYEPGAYGKLWFRAPLAGKVGLGLEAFGSEQRFIDLDSGQFSTLPPSLRLDVRLSRGFTLNNALWRRVDATLAFDNVTDQTLYDQAGLPQPRRIILLQARLQ